MHSAAWVKLFQHIPLSEQAKLMLVTATGMEISIQCFLRIDPDCLALKGRLAGSQDAGRVFFIPYANIDYFGFQQPVKESDFHELFGNLELPNADADAAPAVLAPPPVVPPTAAPVASNPTPALRNPLTIKSSVLEKFRSRTGTNPGTAMRPPVDE
ncbi:MAG TPA: hypothetical protein VN688_28405 [Gemmataceae bacterium]|nr:hypothetical protein [Gemmataceae bacterium]